MKRTSVPITGTADYQGAVNAHFEENCAHWKEVYCRTDLSGTVYQDRRAAVLAKIDSIGLPPESQVLDVGCGAGVLAVALAQRGYRVQAIDTVPAMLEQTRQLALEIGVGGTLSASLGDVHNLAFPARLFDFVLAIGILPWMDSPGRPLAEMLRVLKPGAYLMFTIDNRWRLNHLLDPACFPLLRPIRRGARAVVRRLGWGGAEPAKARHTTHSGRELDAMLQAAGAEKVRVSSIGFGPFTLLNWDVFSAETAIRIHRWLQSLANRSVPGLRAAGSEYLVLARKPEG